MNKQEMRTFFLSLRRALPTAQRRRFSRSIHNRVQRHPAWKNARILGSYLSLDDEVPTSALIRRAWALGKQIAAPVADRAQRLLSFHRLSDATRFQRSGLGVLEPEPLYPVPPEDLDLVLVPGVGFDESGYRLGFGKGYFDRFLKKSRAFRMGLAFEAQITRILPRSPWDMPMDCIVTERRVIALPA